MTPVIVTLVSDVDVLYLEVVLPFIVRVRDLLDSFESLLGLVSHVVKT